MPIERRIREGTERNASVLDPDVERFLGSVVQKGRRRAVIRRSLTVTASIAVVAVAILVGPSMLDDVRGSSGIAPGSSPTSSVPTTVHPVAPLLTGTFTRSIAEGTAVVRHNGIAGTWTIDAANDGTVRLLAPGSFVGAHDSAPFEMQPDMLLSAAFSSDLCSGLPAGSYRWSVQSGLLVLTVISDPCDARVVVLSAGPWAISS